MMPGSIQWPGLKLDIATAQLQGERARQEDSYVVRALERGLVALVADGLGGHERGDEASAAGCAAAAEALMRWLPPEESSWDNVLRQAFTAGHEAVKALGRRRRHGPATTLIGGVIVPETKRFHCANIGDCLAWLWMEGSLRPLFREREQEMDYVLGMSVGGAGYGIAVAPPIDLEVGARLLLASDGVLSVSGITDILALPTARMICEWLIGQAIQRQLPTQDNLTLVVIKVDAP